ncbi:hypothetical protein DFH94DRAFT_463612 [Russula ochroleuca]|uniref:Uncharacterized protein n=1 Tax=Russula ochroleuca TaxID=152965 RepID=A0A9P5T8U6_9AGAM|nr:hypothetical protein DFH94DRAFT_463612 [Russula ochroleuca]
MVATIVRSRLGQDFHQSMDVNFEVAIPTDSETPPQDPWANIFPPSLLHPGIPPLEVSDVSGMYDAEDQVYRCLDCMHEIWGGSCSQCGRHYSGHDVDASDDNASGEEHHGRWGILPAMEHIMGWPRSVGVDESDNGSYESSFIDDEDSERCDNEAVEISSACDDEVTALATRQGREGAGDVQIAFSEGSEDGDEKVSDDSQNNPLRPVLGSRRQVLSDSDVDDNCSHSTESEDDGSLARPPMRLFGRSTMSKGRSVESELSGSDDNGSDGSHASGVQWSGGEFGAFTAEDIAEENSDEDDGW